MSLTEAFFSNSSQAVFTFGLDQKVLPGYTLECKRIFDGDIVGRTVPELLFGETDNAADFSTGADLILTQKTRADVVFDLIDKEIEILDRRVRLDFSLIEGPKIAVFISDITRERRFQEISKRDLTRRFLVLKAVSHQRYFALFTREAVDLFEKLTMFESAQPLIDEAYDLERQLHTFKGSASFFDFFKTVGVTHEFESKLQEYRVLNEEIKTLTHTIELKKAYFSELSSITDILGQKWLDEADSVHIPRNSFRKIEQWLATHHPEDVQLRLALQQYKQVPMRELFVRFPEMAQNLSERLGKRLNSIIVEGGDFYVNPDKMSAFIDELGHVIRNSIDHGIEIPSERIKAGKSDAGTIRIQIEQQPGSILVRVNDDGKGIDLDKVKAKAVSLGLVNDSKVDSLSEAQVLQFILEHGFSTAKEVTEISGRGVGMSAVREVLHKLGGELQIHSRKGRGTTIECSIPFKRPHARRKS